MTIEPVPNPTPDANPVPGKFASARAALRAWKTPILIGTAFLVGGVVGAKMNSEVEVDITVGDDENDDTESE